MQTTEKAPRSCRDHRFRQPTSDDLVAAIDETRREAVDRVREVAAKNAGGESVRWLGVSWKWSICYGGSKRSDTDPPVTLVCDPAAPRLALRLDGETIQELAPQDLHAVIRQAIASATRVGPTVWVELPIETEQHAEHAATLLAIASGEHPS